MEAKEKFSFSKYIELAGLVTGGLSVLYSFITEHFKLELLLPIVIFLMVVLGITVYKRKHFQKRIFILVLLLNIALQLCAVLLYVFKNKKTNVCTSPSTKYGICVCKFDIGKTDDFSYVLSSDLADKNIQMYNGLVNPVDTFIAATQINEIPTFNALIKNACFSKGLLVFGRRSENSKLFICSIYLNPGLLEVINALEVKNTTGEIIKLKNPSNFTFNIESQSDFVSNFILGLFQYVSKNFKASSQTLERLYARVKTAEPSSIQALAVLLANSKAYENKIDEADHIYKQLSKSVSDSLISENLRLLLKFKNNLNDTVSLNKIQPSPTNTLQISKLQASVNTSSLELKILSAPLNSVQIGQQYWTTQNLNVETFKNGEPITEAKTNAEWVKAANLRQPAWCYYNNNPASANTMGKLYNWYAVSDPRGLAPNGWHIPSDNEWKTLTAFLGGNKIAGARLKSLNSNGTNTSNFNATLCGWRLQDGNFTSKNINGYWWSSTASSAGYAWQRSVTFGGNEIKDHNVSAQKGLSVRCVKD